MVDHQIIICNILKIILHNRSLYCRLWVCLLWRDFFFCFLIAYLHYNRKQFISKFAISHVSSRYIIFSTIKEFIYDIWFDFLPVLVTNGTGFFWKKQLKKDKIFPIWFKEKSRGWWGEICCIFAGDQPRGFWVLFSSVQCQILLIISFGIRCLRQHVQGRCSVWLLGDICLKHVLHLSLF